MNGAEPPTEGNHISSHLAMHNTITSQWLHNPPVYPRVETARTAACRHSTESPLPWPPPQKRYSDRGPGYKTLASP